jgi:hypothetical protein
MMYHSYALQVHGYIAPGNAVEQEDVPFVLVHGVSAFLLLAQADLKCVMSLSCFNFGPNCSLQSFSCQLVDFRVYIGVLKTLICIFSHQNVGTLTELFLCILT